MNPAIYYRTFNRALLKYVNNGFFSRDLDADDHAFIEKVREHGTCDCGSLVSAVPSGLSYGYVTTSSLLFEEIEYWRKPFVGEPYHRVPVPRLPEPPQRRLARIERRKRDRELMAAELEGARREWEAQQQERKRNQHKRLMDDLDWERADPKLRASKRHYEPFWKREERLAPERRRRAREMLYAHRKLAEMERQRAAERLQLEQTKWRIATQSEAPDIVEMDAYVDVVGFVKQAIEKVMRDDAAMKHQIVEAVRVRAMPAWVAMTLMERVNCEDVRLVTRCCRKICESAQRDVQRGQDRDETLMGR